MNRDPVAFLKANPALVEQAGILSAQEQDFAARRMPVERTVEMVKAEYAVLEAKLQQERARHIFGSDTLRMMMNLLEEWECLETGELYVPEVVEEEEVDPIEAAREMHEMHREQERKELRLGFGI